jgi:predicted nucleic acid-binding protein
MVVVDSSVWIDFFRGIEAAGTVQLRDLLGKRGIITGDLIVAEVLQGFTHERDFQIARGIFSTMPVMALCGMEIAVRAAVNFRHLRTRGITVRKTIDTIIATWCIENGHALLASDRDFEPFFAHLGLERA